MEKWLFQIDQGSIWDGPWITRAWKNISLDSLEASGTMKNIRKIEKMINSKIDQENEQISM